MGNYSENGIQFTVGDAGIYTGGMKISRLAYQKDNQGNIQSPQRTVNAIDIDWNRAEIPNINDPIVSTGQLLSIIGQLKEIIGGSEGGQSIMSRLEALEKEINGEESSSITNKLNSIEDKLEEDDPDSLAGKISSIEEYINGDDFQGLFSRLSSIENILNNSTFFTVQNENSNNNSNP